MDKNYEFFMNIINRFLIFGNSCYFISEVVYSKGLFNGYWRVDLIIYFVSKFLKVEII